MFLTLYPLAYLLSLTGLVLWFFYQDKPKISRMLSTLFLGGFLVYAFTLAFGPGEFNTKLWVLFRDMVVLGVASQIFMWVKRSQWGFFALLLLTYGLFFTFWKGKMVESFVSTKSPIELEEDSEILLQLSNHDQVSKLESWVNTHNFSFDKAFSIGNNDDTYLDEYFVVDIPDPQQAGDLIKELVDKAWVDWAEPNEHIQIKPLEGNVLEESQSRFANDPGLEKQWGLKKLQTESLHRLIKKNAKSFREPALIAILDTGVDSQHEDLGDQFHSINKKWNSDPMGHGTHCAGVAAAISNNNIGITSLDPDGSFVKVTSVKVLNFFGGGSQRSIIEGMIQAADAGADVISMSLGGLSDQKKQKAYEDAVEYCTKKEAIVVVAAGNSKQDAKDYSPANTPGVITVSAVNENLSLAPFSNFVSNVEMGIAAPGTNIYSTYPKNEYKSFNGTSMAAPFVASLVGILKSVNPKLTTREAYQLMHDSGKKVDDEKRSGRFIQPADCLNNYFAKNN